MKNYLLWILIASTYSKQCPFGYFNAFGEQVDENSQQKCVECPTTCFKCTSFKGLCIGCAAGLYLPSNQSKCVSCKDGVLKCDDEDNFCQPHYELQFGICIPTCQVDNCLQCSSIFTKQCNKCWPSFVLSVEKNVCEKQAAQQKDYQINPNANSPSTKSNIFPTPDQFPQLPAPIPGFRSNLIVLPPTEKTTSTPTVTDQSINPNSNPFPTNEMKNCETVEPQFAIIQKKAGKCIYCKIGQYYDRAINQCLDCQPTCSTCIYSANQCLECNSEKYVKKGWKCISKDHLTFLIQLNLNGNNLQSRINQIKLLIVKGQDFQQDPLLRFRLLQRVTIENAEYLPQDKVILSGYIDQSNNLSGLQDRRFMSQNFRKISEVTPFTYTHFEIVSSASPDAQDEEKKKKSKQRLSKGLIAFIVVVSIQVFCIVLRVCVICYRHPLCSAKKRQNNNASTQGPLQINKNSLPGTKF